MAAIASFTLRTRRCRREMQARKCANESHSPHLMQYVLPRDLKRVPARILLEAGPDKGGDLSDLPLPPRVPRSLLPRPARRGR